MTTPRKPRVDWDAAKAFYVALGPEHRTFSRVATEYHITDHTVGKWAKRHDWVGAAAKADAAAAEKLLAKAGRSLEARQADTIRVADKLRETVLAEDVKLDPNVAVRALPRFAHLEQLYAGEATGRIEVSEVSAAFGVFFEVIGKFVPADVRAAAFAELDQGLAPLLGGIGLGEAAA